MKVALVRPRYKTHIINPPLGIAYLAAYLKSHQVEVVVIDGLRDALSPEDLAGRIAAHRPDLVGISCLTAYYYETARLCALVKERGIATVIGGVHPTFLPYSTLRETGADFVVCGEGERALLALAQNGKSGVRIPGVYRRGDLQSDADPVERAQIVENLDELPFPDWGEISPGSYPIAPHGAVVKAFPVGALATTRGCVNECTFCASPGFYQRRIRFRSPESVVAEIEYLRDAFAVKEIHFIDDNLSFRREHLRRICALLLEKGIRIPWACPNGVRADSIDQETLYLMKKSGCYSLAFGVESADRTILEGVKKHETIDVIRRAIEMTARAGITCQGFFIFGLPGETRRTIDETIRFATGSKLARAQFLILDVLPGSALWEQLRGKFLPRWDKESFREPEWVPEGLTKRDLLSAQTRAFKAFYFRPLILIRMLSFLKFRQIIFLFSRLRDYRILAAHRDVSPRKNGVPPLSGLARKKKIRHFISGIPKSAKILEVGSGDGWLGKYLTGNGWRDYTGLSMTAPADIVGDVARWKELGIAPGSFDVVIAFEVMEHVECVNELCAMLKDGGLLLATLPLPHMDWFCRALEIAGLNQKRGTPHANLRYCKKLPPFETVDYRIVGGISQWGIYRKPIASHQRQHP